ncbi:hypothetical protein Efla_002946 [Eimeria flavescens]
MEGAAKEAAAAARAAATAADAVAAAEATAAGAEAAAAAAATPSAAAPIAAAAGAAAGWRVKSLSVLLQLHALLPFTVLLYPPPSDPFVSGAEALGLAASMLRDWIHQRQQQQQHQEEEEEEEIVMIASRCSQRKPLLTDGLNCIRRLTERQPEEAPFEILAKERVHGEACLLVCLLPLIGDPETGHREVSLLTETLLPLQGGADCCMRVDVLSLD